MYNVRLEGLTDNSFSDFCTYPPTLGNLSLTVHTYGEFYCNAAYRTDRAGMNQHLLLYTLSGKGKLHYGGRQFDLLPNTLMLIDCAKQQLYHTDGEAWHFLFVHFTGTAAKEFCALVTQNENFCVPARRPNEFIKVLSELVVPRGRSLPYDVLHASHLLEKVFLTAIAEQNENTEYRKALSPVDGTLQYVAEHYGEKITLDDLAKNAYLSKYHLLRLFSRVTGATPMDYLRAYRIGQAQILLKTADLSVEEIALRTGYENTAAFIRAFRRQTGTTPGKYKSF